MVVSIPREVKSGAMRSMEREMLKRPKSPTLIFLDINNSEMNPNPAAKILPASTKLMCRLT